MTQQIPKAAMSMPHATSDMECGVTSEVATHGDTDLGDTQLGDTRSGDRRPPASETGVDLTGTPDSVVRAQIIVRGITCNGCCRRIEAEIGALRGVLEVNLNYTTHVLSVAIDTDEAAPRDVLQTLEALGFEGMLRPQDRPVRADQRERRGLLVRFAVSAALMVQIMMLTMALYFSASLGIEPAFEQLFEWGAAALTLPVLVVGSSVFFRGAAVSLRGGRVSMDVTVSLAMLVAFVASVSALFGLTEHIYFDALAMFTVFLLGARFIETDQRVNAIDTLERLVFEHPVTAHRECGEQGARLEDLAADQLRPGDRVRVREGEVLPADGVVLDGTASVDESLLTGESQPVYKTAGAAVIGGTLNLQGSLRVEVRKAVCDGTFARVRKAAEALQAERPPIRQWADRVAGWFLFCILILAGLLAALGLGLSWDNWLDRVIAVLIVTCPCALSLATPAALTATAVALSARGIIVRRLAALEFLTRATHVAFDKTGTLTSGQLALVAVTLSAHARTEGRTEPAILSAAAALEEGANHPVARALRRTAPEQIKAHCVELHPGLGVSGTVDGVRLRLGSQTFISGSACQDMQTSAADTETEAGILVLLADDRGVLAELRFSDPVRAEARSVVAALRARSMVPLIISGDRQHNADAVGAAVGIERALGGVSPTGKADCLAAILREDAPAKPLVVAVGDGVNDAPMFGCADVSVALGGHAALASEIADLTITGARLDRLPELFAIARRMRRVLYQNFAWAIGYNLVAVPAAALGWVPPWLAALGMTASSILVTLNAARIGRTGVRSGSESERRRGGEA